MRKFKSGGRVGGRLVHRAAVQEAQGARSSLVNEINTINQPTK